MLTAIIAAKVQADMENEMYKSLITGLMEDLHDIREFGEPQGWKTVIAEDKKTTLLTQKDFYGMDREINLPSDAIYEYGIPVYGPDTESAERYGTKK